MRPNSEQSCQNPRFLAPETREIHGKKAYCDGDGVGGHPGIYLNAGDKPFVDCPYCGRRFVRDDAPDA
ncbi:MAG: zinc-finger domain-containing protein [Rickettsiales bacterium]